MKASRRTYYLIKKPDRPGEALALLKALSENNVDLDAMWGYGTPSGDADFYLVPREPHEFESFALRTKLPFEKSTCFRIEGSDHRGCLVEMMSSIAENSVSISALNATVVGGEVGGYIWSKQGDVELVAQALGA